MNFFFERSTMKGDYGRRIMARNKVRGEPVAVRQVLFNKCRACRCSDSRPDRQGSGGVTGGELDLCKSGSLPAYRTARHLPIDENPAGTSSRHGSTRRGLRDQRRLGATCHRSLLRGLVRHQRRVLPIESAHAKAVQKGSAQANATRTIVRI